MKWIRSMGVALIMALGAAAMLGQSPDAGQNANAPSAGQSATPTAPGQAAPATGAAQSATPTAPGQAAPATGAAQPATPSAPGQAAPATGAAQSATPPVPARPLLQVTCPAIAPQANPAQFHWKHGLAEYNAYSAATKATGAQQAQLFAQFAQKFPDSDYRNAALEGEMQSDARAGQTNAAVQVARQLITSGADASTQVNAFFLIGELLPTNVQLQSNLPLVSEAGQCGLKALAQMPRPANASPSSFAASQTAAKAIFERAIGFVELHRKNYAGAVGPLTRATQMNPQDPSSYYWLGISQLYSQPPNFLGGIFSLARASDLAPSTAIITNYFQKAYTSYHGSANGMQSVLALAKTNNDPPASFTIVSQAQKEMAAEEAKLKAEEYAAAHALPPSNTFEGIEARLKIPAKAPAIWRGLRDVPIELDNAVVIHSTPTILLLAVGKTYQKENQADVRLDLVIRHVYRRGGMLNVEGVPVTYHVHPHFLLVLDKGHVVPQHGRRRR